MSFELALIGYPLSHSHSAAFFTDKFAREGIDARYFNAPLASIEELPRLLEEHPALIGFNVTAPYKEAVIPYLHELSPQARKIGAVNTVKIIRSEAAGTPADPRLAGHNTDCTAFRASLSRLMQRAGITPRDDMRALIAGTGGASKAAVQACLDLGITPARVSRTPGRAEYSYEDLTEEVMLAHRIIINATPLGTYPNTDAAPPLPYGLITPAHVCFDMVYNPPLSLFLRQAGERGASTANGAEMLRLQALEAYGIWTAEAGSSTSGTE